MLLGGGSNCQGCGCASPGCWDGVTPSTGYDPAGGNQDFFGRGIVISSATTLHSVTIYNSGLSQPLIAKVGGGYTNAPFVKIYSSTTDPLPNAVLATLTPPSSFTSSSWVFTHAGLSLSASTIYWVVLGAPLGQYANWNWIEYPSFDVSSGCYFLSCGSGNGGASWAGGYNGNQYLMDYS